MPEWTVGSGEVGLRLDKYLASPDRAGSRPKAAAALERGKVFVNDREMTLADAAARVAAGDVVRLWMDRPGSAKRRSSLGADRDLPVVYEDEDSVVFDFAGTLINLLERSAAISLVEPETVADRSAGSRFMLSIWVDDVDSSCLELSARGVDLMSGPIDRDWGKRTASFTDPDGNIWELAQDIPAAGTQGL